MDIQYISLKFYADNGDSQKLEAYIPVFHRWIQQNVAEELLIDVADYSHVPAGPGVMLIAHEADYSVEFGAENRFGVLYKTKLELTGSNSDRLREIFQQTLQAAARLQKDNQLSPTPTFNGNNFRLTFDRRSNFLNDDAGFKAAKTEVQNFLISTIKNQDASIQQVNKDSSERLVLDINLRENKLNDLLHNLQRN